MTHAHRSVHSLLYRRFLSASRHRDALALGAVWPRGRVTALGPMIGYDKASAIAHKTNDEGLTLKETALQCSDIDEEGFDEVVDPRTMVGRLLGWGVKR